MKMMMKSLVRKLVLPLLLISLLGGSALAQGRIATVELRKVFDGYWKTKQADAALKDRAADIEKDHKTMLDDWKKVGKPVVLWFLISLLGGSALAQGRIATVELRKVFDGYWKTLRSSTVAI